MKSTSQKSKKAQRETAWSKQKISVKRRSFEIVSTSAVTLVFCFLLKELPSAEIQLSVLFCSNSELLGVCAKEPVVILVCFRPKSPCQLLSLTACHGYIAAALSAGSLLNLLPSPLCVDCCGTMTNLLGGGLTWTPLPPLYLGPDTRVDEKQSKFMFCERVWCWKTAKGKKKKKSTILFIWLISSHFQYIYI